MVTKHNKKRKDKMLDYSSLSVQELEDVSQSALREIERRHNETELPERIDRLAGMYQQAIGRVDGDPWVQPTGAHDAYRQNSTVTHNGKTWVNLILANVWEPGTSGWGIFTEEGGVPAEWVQPSGVHDAYNTGDQVTFEGSVWESVIDGNIWSPYEHPQGWKNVDEPITDDDGGEPEESSPDPDPETGEVPVEDEPEVEEPVEEEPVEDEPVPDFVQPTGEHDAYDTGDLVTFEGEVWESIIDVNVWSPTANPAGWKKV